MTQGRNAGIGKITVATGNIKEVLRKNDVVIKKERIFRKMFCQFRKEFLNQGKFASGQRGIFISAVIIRNIILIGYRSVFFWGDPFFLQVTKYAG